VRTYTVSSALFVPGRIFAAARIERELQALVARRYKLEAELSRIPGRIESLTAELRSAQFELKELG
jgi:uncharacterized protein (UPF0335 family)